MKLYEITARYADDEIADYKQVYVSLMSVIERRSGETFMFLGQLWKVITCEVA